jgi:transposase
VNIEQEIAIIRGENAQNAKLIAALDFLQKEHVRNKQETRELQEELRKLQNTVLLLQRSMYGKKSEKLPPVNEAQLSLLLASDTVPTPQQREAEVTVPEHKRSKKRKTRDVSQLPVVQVVHEPTERACSCCSAPLTEIGKDVSKELESHPAKLYIKEHIRPRYACSACQNKVVQAELPCEVKPLARSIASANLLSQVCVAKYVDHVPLHRQEVMFQREGFELKRKVLCDWVSAVVTQYLERLWQALKKEVLQESYLQADETTIKIQDGKDEGKCHTGYLWGALAPEKGIIFFEYAESRAGSVAQDIFADFRGNLQTDLYAGYNTVVLPAFGVERLSCLAHVRRKFIELQKAYGKECGRVLFLIGELYHKESSWKNVTPEERTRLRQKHSIEILDKLKKYLQEIATKTLPRADLMKAIHYALSQWQNIEAIFADGRFHLDNNAIERQMRPIALGRKNYLFAGSHNGAHHAAVFYSLFATAKLHGVNPRLWLTHVLKTMRDLPVSQISELLPHRCALDTRQGNNSMGME